MYVMVLVNRESKIPRVLIEKETQLLDLDLGSVMAVYSFGRERMLVHERNTFCNDKRNLWNKKQKSINHFNLIKKCVNESVVMKHISNSFLQRKSLIVYQTSYLDPTPKLLIYSKCLPTKKCHWFRFQNTEGPPHPIIIIRCDMCPRKSIINHSIMIVYWEVQITRPIKLS